MAVARTVLVALLVVSIVQVHLEGARAARMLSALDVPEGRHLMQKKEPETPKDAKEPSTKEAGAKAFFDIVKKFSRGGNKEASDAAADGDDDGRRRLLWNSNVLAEAVVGHGHPAGAQAKLAW